MQQVTKEQLQALKAKVVEAKVAAFNLLDAASNDAELLDMLLTIRVKLSVSATYLDYFIKVAPEATPDLEGAATFAAGAFTGGYKVTTYADGSSSVEVNKVLCPEAPKDTAPLATAKSCIHLHNKICVYCQYGLTESQNT